jgi:hypothetical protein
MMMMMMMMMMLTHQVYTQLTEVNVSVLLHNANI